MMKIIIIIIFNKLIFIIAFYSSPLTVTGRITKATFLPTALNNSNFF